MLKVLLILYAAMAITAFIGGFLISYIEGEDETNVLAFAFHLQIETISNLYDDLNTVGIIIVLIVETAFLLPCNIILMLVKIIEYAVIGAWNLFKKAFRRKEDGE